MFQKSLQDIVKFTRQGHGDIRSYVSLCLQETKDECNDRDPEVLAKALLKLFFVRYSERRVLLVDSPNRYS